MAQYLKSLVTGVVLPYVEASLKSADIRKMSAEECAEYEAGINGNKSAAPAKRKPAKRKKTAEPAIGEIIVEDVDPTEEVLGALETD